jgi:hypothetical protein
MRLANYLNLPTVTVNQLTALSAEQNGSILNCSDAFADGTPDLVYWTGSQWIRVSDRGIPGTGFVVPTIVQRNNFGELVNTAAETNIFVYPLPADILGTEQALHVKMVGDFLNNTGANQNLTLRVSVGGNLWADNSGNIATNANRRPWSMELLFSNLGQTNQNYLNGTLIIGQAGGATTGVGDMASAGYREAVFGSNGLLTINTALPQTLSIFAQLSSANANLSFRRYKAIATIV